MKPIFVYYGYKPFIHLLSHLLLVHCTQVNLCTRSHCIKLSPIDFNQRNKIIHGIKVMDAPTNKIEVIPKRES